MMSERLEEDRLRRLVEIGPSLVSELDLETVLDRLLETAREMTGARYAALGVLDAERRELERFLTRGLSDDEERAIGARPRGRGVLGLVVDDPRPLRVGVLSEHPSSFGFPAGHPPMRSFLGVPILIRGRAWGNLYLTEKPDGDFDDGDEQAAVTLAAWAAIAIEHARLLAAAGQRQEALERAVRGLEATQAIAVALGAETDLSRVLELIAKRGRAMVEARSVVILLQDGHDLVLAAGAGHSQPHVGVRIPVAHSTSGQVMLAQRPSRITNLDSQLQVSPQTLGVPDAHFALLVPLIYRGRTLGVLAAFDRGQEAQTFTEDDEQVLVAFAASAATAVATAQTVQADRLRHTLEAAEAERRHWARELHDETLQALGGLKVLASAARRYGDLARVSAALDEIVAGLEGEIESVHAIISELRPASLDDLGLRPAIETLAQRHRVVHGTEVECRLTLPDPTENDRRLAPELETAVYRLVQEALTNVSKHANAKRVMIDVGATDGQVKLEIADDGTGFDVGVADAGFGLTGMRERVALTGGTIDISSDGSGTTVRATLPERYAIPADDSARPS
ncbi:MAG: GAF domain-containing protein [Actinomycetota bacterium]|nr:GAF domain-containing protein [Actinomycetota bacterium]